MDVGDILLRSLRTVDSRHSRLAHTSGSKMLSGGVSRNPDEEVLSTTTVLMQASGGVFGRVRYGYVIGYASMAKPTLR